MKIGILGGGQLGRMLWEASRKLGLSPSQVFHETRRCPAGIAGAEVREAKITDHAALTDFFKSTDSFAIENEFLPLDSLRTAWDAAGKLSSTPRPSWKGLEIAQDKLEQKMFFQREKLPTSEFVEITRESLSQKPTQVFDLHRAWNGLVLKRARMGYDGKGNYLLPPMESETLKDLTSSVQGFCEATFAAGSRLYAERFVPFTREVALVSVRTIGGGCGHFPLIETVQKNGVCFLAYTATQAEALQQEAFAMARHIGEQLQLLGTFAVEFFVSKEGQLVVNEMAPRVHNSGHFTQLASTYSQFDLHLRAYFETAWQPSDFQSAPAFVMVNLLGPKGLNGPIAKPASTEVYWYDKETTSPGRKLGHIILHSQVANDLTSLVEQAKRLEASWQQSLLR